MTSALAFKEFRETIGIALVGLLLMLGLVLMEMGWNPLFSSVARRAEIPFVSDDFMFEFGLLAGAFALALGLRQSLGDDWGDAHQFLLTRPVHRTTIYGVKLAVGLLLYLVFSAAPVILYASWAATPGTHASPFFWSMTAASWFTYLAITSIYLGAVLSGVRPARWFGTRLAPLAAAIFLAAIAATLGNWVGVAIVAVADVLLLLAIRFVVEHRDFA